LAYVAIPIVLIYFTRRRRDLPFPWMFWMFGAFIIGCGTTHLMEVITSATPVYRLSGVVKLLTAGVSVATAVALVPLVPKALLLRSPRELEKQFKERERAEERFRELLESAPDAIVIVKQDGKIALINKQTERLFGYQPDELLDQPVEILVPERFRSQHVEHRINYFAHPSVRPMGATLNLYGRRKDGTEFPVEISLSPLVTEEGTLVSSAIRDVTARKRAEDRFRGLLESAPDAIVIVRQDGKIALTNKQTERLFGYKPEELLDQPVEILVPERFRGQHVEHRINYFAHPSVRPMGATLNLYGRHKDGREFPVEISLSPLVTEEGTLVSSAIRDVTARRRIEEKLAAYAHQLERSNRELEQFASVASHDLQEPLRKIQAFGDRLQATSNEALGEEGRKYLERMQAAAARMRALINDLLTFARLTTKVQPFAPVNLGPLAHQIVSDLEGRIQQTRGRVEVGDLPTVDADPMQMRQLLQNLISNGLKFHRPGEPPVVKVEGRVLTSTDRLVDGDGKGDPLCLLTVADNGIGFEESYLDRIFEAFQRLHARHEYEGTGMGLAISRKIVERHHGTITARSAPGQGATFIVTLPVKQHQGGIAT
jgi:PAS domain S-box-containing protein